MSGDKHNPGGAGENEAGCYDWLVGPGEGICWKRRRRYSSLVLPVGWGGARSDLVDTEAEERKVTVKTAARLGCAVGNLSKRQQKMLLAKVTMSWPWQ